MTTENQPQETDENGFLKTDTPIVDPAAPQTQAPKKRGRKSNEERARIAAEQLEAGGPAATGTAPRKKAANRKSYTTADIGAMAKQLVGLHQIGAMMTGIPEIQISEQEAAALSAAIVNISEQYDLAIDGKTGALIQILGTAAMIYVPRISLINARAKANKVARQQAAQNGTVESPTVN